MGNIVDDACCCKRDEAKDISGPMSIQTPNKQSNRSKSLRLSSLKENVPSPLKDGQIYVR